MIRRFKFFYLLFLSYLFFLITNLWNNFIHDKNYTIIIVKFKQGFTSIVLVIEWNSVVIPLCDFLNKKLFIKKIKIFV